MKELNVNILLPEIIYHLGIWTILFYRKFRYGCEFRIIELTQGLRAIVDPQDYDRLAAFSWYASKSRRTWYAQCSGRLDIDLGKRRHISMHREVMSLPAVSKVEPSNGQILGAFDDRFVDHQNHNGLDNRRSNLRIATLAENSFNRRKTSASSTSRFKGVSWDKREAKWRVQGRLNGRQATIGYFDIEEDAAKAYDAWAKQAFGQFAALNFPRQTDPLGDWSFKICYGKYTG